MNASAFASLRALYNLSEVGSSGVAVVNGSKGADDNNPLSPAHNLASSTATVGLTSSSLPAHTVL